MLRTLPSNQFLTRKLAKVEAERRKLLEASYAGAIEVALLRSEQQRLAKDIREIDERLKAVEATLAEWQEVLTIAFKFATNCGKAYRSANGRTRKLYNSGVFERLAVRNGEITRSHIGNRSARFLFCRSSNKDVWSTTRSLVRTLPLFARRWPKLRGGCQIDSDRNCSNMTPPMRRDKI